MVEGNIKTFQIVKVEKNVLTKGKLEEVQNMKLRNKDSYSAAKKAANAIFKNAPKNKKSIKFIIENQKKNKSGINKQLAYTSTRNNEKKIVKLEKGKKELEFTTSPTVKSCLKTEVA